MLVYVDDVLIISSSLTLIARIKTELQAKFVIIDLGLATYFLGAELKALRNCSLCIKPHMFEVSSNLMT
jgi:hypothetical protein